MTVATPPYVQQGQSHTAALFRQAQAASLGTPPGVLFAGGIQAVTAGGGHGVCGSGQMAVSQNTGADMNCRVAIGYAMVTGTENASQGTYVGYNDAIVTLAVSASDPTNPRKDLVVLKVRDAFYSGGSTDMSLAVVTGTPNAAPVDPTVPANALVLGRILVPAASTAVTNANITQLATRAASLGATMVCTSTTRPTGVSLYDGLEIWETDTHRLLRYDGTGFICMAEPFQSLSPTFTNFTLGNGIVVCRYHRSDGYCEMTGRVTLGTTSSVTGGPIGVNVPTGTDLVDIDSIIASRYYGSPGGSSFFLQTIAATTTRLDIYAENAAGANTSLQATNATVPGTWAATNVFRFGGRWLMASRYG